jgi:riboflavin biosynthesis pyrimidine reductase
MTNGLVDEWFVTIAGLAIAGTAPRITQATSEVEERLSMRTTFSDGRDLFLSYVRDDQPAAT